MSKWVYAFGGGRADGGASMGGLLGGKGANLAEMSGLGIPVPPGFTITTEVCAAFYAGEHRYPDGLEDAVRAALARVEAIIAYSCSERFRVDSGVEALGIHDAVQWVRERVG